MTCHAAATTGEGASAEPEATPEVVEVPALLSHPSSQGGANTCYDCHVKLDGNTGEAARQWATSIHAKRGVVCADCHGGDPNAADAAAAMSPDAGFIGKPDRTQIPDICGACHANVSMMRQYDLPTDQLAQYRQSIHGQHLAAGDIKVATCFDCHDGHATPETNDPIASVYPLNVPKLCASCHADAAYMAPYNIPTDQYDLYKTSVHGIALLDNQDTRAPSCATCHGTHGAAPPGFNEVANVCGSCHTATQDYYLAGPHNSDNPDAPRCVTCHGRYDVGVPSEAMFSGDDARHCGSCHASDSDVGRVVTQLQQSLTEAAQSLEQADASVQQAAAVGMIVEEEQSLLTDARTRLITARAAQHTANIDTVKTETDASIQLSQQAQEQSQAAIAESQFRRKAMVIALVVIVLIITSLVLLRRELAAR